MDIVANYDDVNRAFSGMAPELSGGINGSFNNSFNGVTQVIVGANGMPSESMMPPLWVPPDEQSGQQQQTEVDDRMLRKFASSTGAMDMDIFDSVFNKTASMERSF